VRVAICVSRLPMVLLSFLFTQVCRIRKIAHRGGLLQRCVIVGQVAATCLTKDSKAIVCGVN
jgi:hypothetical protein